MDTNHGYQLDCLSNFHKAAVLTSDGSLVLMKRNGSKITFPDFNAINNSSDGDGMSRCMTLHLKKILDISCELVFLESTSNDPYFRHAPSGDDDGTGEGVEDGSKLTVEQRLPEVAVFECTNDVMWEGAKKSNEPFCEGCYEWFSTSELGKIGKGKLEWYGNGEICVRFALDARPGVPNDEPWKQCGWYNRTCCKAKSVLEGLGYTLQDEFVPFAVTSNGSVSRVETNRGGVYLKRTKIIECKVTKLVASFASFIAPMPLHVDENDGWMLMNDHGKLVEEYDDWGDVNRLAGLYAKMQRASVDHVDELKQIGVESWSSERMKEFILEVLNEEDVVVELERINRGEFSVSMYKDWVWAYFEIYDELDLPVGLQHGDDGDHNISKRSEESDEYALIDWGDAYISVAFFYPTFLSNYYILMPPWNRESLWEDPYFKEWQDYWSEEDIHTVRKMSELPSAVDSIKESYDYSKKMEYVPCLLKEDVVKLRRLLTIMNDILPMMKKMRPGADVVK